MSSMILKKTVCTVYGHRKTTAMSESLPTPPDARSAGVEFASHIDGSQKMIGVTARKGSAVILLISLHPAEGRHHRKRVSPNGLTSYSA